MQLPFIVLVLFQVYCFYHIYKNRDKAYWYIIILLLPMIGGIVYLLRNVSTSTVTDFQAKTTPVATKNTNINALKEQVELSDTVSNKIRLADAYVQKTEYEKAISIYQSCFNKFTEDDEELNEKLLAAYYHNEDYINTIAFGKKLETYRFFANSKEKTYYAWSYFELNDDEMAEQVFEEMNIDNTNYYHRKEYAKFLLETERPAESKLILEDISNEIKEMDPYERKNLRDISKEVSKIMNQL